MPRSFPSLAFLCLLSACIQSNPPAVDYGVVISVQPIEMAAENTGVGGIAGGSAGGLAGAQFGRGSGNVAATLGGIVVGAIAGTAIESAAQGKNGLSYTLKLDDGRVVTIVQHQDANEPQLLPGQRALISTTGRDQRVRSAAGS